MSEETPYAVHCPEHGKQCLSEAQYDAQMRRPNSRWACPKCGETCWWDDEHYERAMGLDSEPDPDEHDREDAYNAQWEL